MTEGGNNRRINVPSLYGKARPPQPTSDNGRNFSQEWRWGKSDKLITGGVRGPRDIQDIRHVYVSLHT